MTPNITAFTAYWTNNPYYADYIDFRIPSHLLASYFYSYCMTSASSPASKAQISLFSLLPPAGTFPSIDSFVCSSISGG
jgi:hypothetical protein